MLVSLFFGTQCILNNLHVLFQWIFTCDWPLRRVITGSAVALHCCKAHSNINRKMENSTACKIVTPKNFNSKLCIRDYVGKATHHANFGFNGTVGASPHIREILPLCDFLFWLSCPVLSFFFSGTRPGRTAERFMAQTTCFGARKCFWGVRMTGDVIWGKYTFKTPQKWAWIGNFKPKRQNIKITVSPKL